MSDYNSQAQNDVRRELFQGWLSLQPHIPLLNSQDEPIQFWSLFCVGEFARLAGESEGIISGQNAPGTSRNQIWHDLGLNDGESR